MLVVVVNDELAPLWSKHHGVGNVNEELAMCIVYFGVGKVVGLLSCFLCLITRPHGNIMECEPRSSILTLVLARLKNTSVPIDIASRAFAVLCKFGYESLGILIIHIISLAKPP